MSLTIERPGALHPWIPALQYPFHDHYLNVDGGKMHFIDEGVGNPIVFIHGVPTWSFIYRHLIRGLQGSYRCIAPDLIGFGLSEKPTEWCYSPLNQSRNIAQLIDHLGLDKVTLVGHDFGVGIAMSYAIDNPERVSRVVVLNGSCWDLTHDPMANRTAKIANGVLGKAYLTKMNNWSKIVRRTFADRTKFTDSFSNAVAGPFEAAEDRIGIWKTTKALAASGPFFDDIWRSRSKLVDIPFQFIWGMKDPVFGEKSLNRWWHEYPLAPVVRLDRTGHIPMEEKPADVLAALNDFMTAVPNVRYFA